MTGKDIIVVISQNNTALASTRIRSHDIQTKVDTIEKASSSQQSWKEYIAGRKDWSITVSYLVLAAAKIADLLKVGQTFSITVKDSGSTTSVSGTAILTSVKQTATVGNLAQGSFTFQGSGALS
mgnify:CR=1 FL=1